MSALHAALLARPRHIYFFAQRCAGGGTLHGSQPEHRVQHPSITPEDGGRTEKIAPTVDTASTHTLRNKIARWHPSARRRSAADEDRCLDNAQKAVRRTAIYIVSALRTLSHKPHLQHEDSYLTGSDNIRGRSRELTRLPASSGPC